MKCQEYNVHSEVTFPNWVLKEIRKARQKHGPILSAHEGYSILLEEMDELWHEVRKSKPNPPSEQMLRELIQIGAMAQRMAEDVVMDFIPPSLINER